MSKRDEITTNDLRHAAASIFIAVEDCVAVDISNKLRWAADEIDKLSTLTREFEVAEECPCHKPIDAMRKLGFKRDIPDNFPNCQFCHGSGTITRQATWEEYQEAFEIFVEWAGGVKLKSGGRLRVKK